ncbi:general transcription factor 3C polypeptide 2-like isoform X2 [Centruroides vittatus]|uniref:general transcription factor 3C polypeptide 2-like isoform X2 n=1 Tax=Centruroides vittatus TaxID=120091 RepID=UPI00350EF108
MGRRKRGKKRLRENEDEDSRDNALEVIPCEVCGKQLRPSSIYAHMRFIHSDENIKKAKSKKSDDIQKSKRSKVSENNLIKPNSEDLNHLSEEVKKDVPELIPCEVCGKQLRPSSIYAHMRFIHSNQDTEFSDLKTLENNNQCDAGVPNKTQRNGDRKSKCRAKAFLKVFLKDNDVSHTDKKLIKSKDKDFVIEDNKLSSDSDLGSEEIESDDDHYLKTDTVEGNMFILENKKLSRTEKLLKQWVGKYKILEHELKPVTKEMMHDWRQELETSGVVMCKNKGCEKLFTTTLGIKYHAPRCQNDKNFECLICLKIFKYKKTSLLAHMENYHKCLSENKEIANKDKCKKQKASLGLYWSSSKESFDLHMKYVLRYNKSDAFKEWKPKLKAWELLSESAIEKYLPLERISAKIRIGTNEESEAQWHQLKLFESLPITNEYSSRTFYVGGPIWASAWCPTPINVTSAQYVALSCCRDSNEYHNFVPDKLQPTLIQIWDVGLTEYEKNDTKEFKLPNFIGIAVDQGEIWDMVWCPSGCWEDSSLYKNTLIDEILPRLGLLAVACSDSCIRIYSIPHPEFLKKNSSNNIYQTEAIVLKISEEWLGPQSELGVCTCVDWQTTNDNRFIAGGFANGMIFVWDLFTSSPLLKFSEENQLTILPHLSFCGSSTNITDLAWSPSENGCFLASVSAERTLKIWNLDNPNWPVYVYRQGLFQSLEWQPRGIFFTSDYCYKNYNNSANILNFEDTNSYSLSVHNGCIWDISISGWKDMMVSCDSSGELVGVMLHRLERRKSDTWHSRVPLYRFELEPLDKEERSTKEGIVPITDMEIQSPISVDSGIQEENAGDIRESKKLPPKQTYGAVTANYGIVIKEFVNLNKLSKKDIERIKTSTSMNFTEINDYPLTSINSVCWNPNLDYHQWLFSGGQAGLARLIHVSGMSNLQWYRKLS